MDFPITAGRSDKYGQVYVEKIGNTSFDDLDEPVALFRAQDEWALFVMDTYLGVLRLDERVPREQVESVERQVEIFHQWRSENREKIRIPGTKT